MRIILNVAHSDDTPGKCSPDGSFREWEYSSLICRKIAEELKSYGYTVSTVYQKTYYGPDKGLKQVVTDVNRLTNLSAGKAIMVSVHVNASAKSGWDTASYWCAFTTKGITKADKLADCLYWAAEQVFKKKGKKISYGPKDAVSCDKEENFYVLQKTKCPAVLTENFMQNNGIDIDYLMSPAGMNDVVKVHVDGIIAYLQKQ